MTHLDRVAEIVVAVLREALRERGLERVVVLLREDAPVDLLLGWLDAAGLDTRTEPRAPAGRDALIVDPATKEVLLLDGPLPGADAVPLGDVWGSRVTRPPPGTPLEGVERALAAVFDEGGGLHALSDHLSPDAARDVRARLLRTAPLLRPPLVPKLTEWTAGIDPGP